MRLNARHVRAVYTLFLSLPPYSGWKLPPPDQVTFGVNSRRDEYGRYQHEGMGLKHPGRHYIEISRHNIKSLQGLVVTMAHEILHLYQQVSKTYTRSQHNREFVRLAKRVCKTLGFESKGFA